jgi:hypothetical protein
MSRVAFFVAILCFSSAETRADDDKPADIDFHAAAYSFPCLDKTPKELKEAKPDRRIIETSIRVSVSMSCFPRTSSSDYAVAA